MNYTIIKGKNKGTIVFIHGNSSSSNVFKHIMRSTTITQTKIAVDLPGHGTNVEGYENLEDFSIISLRNKLIAFINKIDDDVLLVANSYGGHLAIEISNKLTRLKGLVIFGTPPLKKPLNIEEAFLPITALQTFFTENPTETEIKKAANALIFRKENNYIIIENFKKSNPKVRRAITIDMVENNFLDEYHIFTNLKVSKFIIAGDYDPSVNLAYLKEVKNNCNENCELLLFNDCGHFPSIERPDEFTSTIEKIASKTF